MKSKTSSMILFGLLLCCLPLGGCRARLQEVIRDREEIRDLEGRVVRLRGEKQDLVRERDAALAKVQVREATAREAEMAKESSPLAGIEAALAEEGIAKGDVILRYRNQRLSFGVPSSVTFSSGSTKVTKSGRILLKRLARVIKRKFPGRRTFIEGHSDSSPIKRTKKLYRNNRHLSVMRAEAVASFLIKEGGLDDQLVVIVGYGPHDPLSNKDKAKNRRVEIVIGS